MFTIIVQQKNILYIFFEFCCHEISSCLWPISCSDFLWFTYSPYISRTRNVDDWVQLPILAIFLTKDTLLANTSSGGNTDHNWNQYNGMVKQIRWYIFLFCKRAICGYINMYMNLFIYAKYYVWIFPIKLAQFQRYDGSCFHAFEKKVTEAGFGIMPICHILYGHTCTSRKFCFYQ